MARFTEVQRFRQVWLWAALAAAVGLTVFLAVWCYGEDGPVVLVAPAAFLAFSAWFLCLRLTTEVRDDEVWMKFFPMWKAKRIPFSAIERVEAVTYRPLLDYGGWGIRLGRKGWAYNVSGNRGVAFTLTGGKRFLLGSQRPEELVAAIEERRAARN